MYRIVLVFLFFTCSLKAAAQSPVTKNDSSNIYKVYTDQFASLLASRGLPPPEVDELLKAFKANNISSDKDFASLLGKLYPAGKGIGILFYFFNNNELRRVLFEPGKVREEQVFSITKEELLQLGVDMNHVLDLYGRAGSKTPSQRGIIVKERPASRGATYESVIQKLTGLLLPKELDERYKHLIIIPALNIGTFPFYLLKPYKDDSLLIDKCSLTIVPGVADLLGLRVKTLKKATGWSGDLQEDFDNNNELRELDKLNFILENPLFICNPAYPTNTPYIFPNLPGAKKEIDMAKGYAQKYTLLDSTKAVKDSVIKYMKHADVAYFATHGVADAEQPMEKSFLVLSGNDPFLTARNIMDLRNTKEEGSSFPEMVILSACQTGLGRSMEAGVTGLARSFLLAGCNHVIMSLWNVDDNATAYLMNRFIYHLQEFHQFMPSEPLRLALLDTRKKFPAPSQWASFSLFGIDY